MNENEFATGSVPVMVAARIYGKDACHGLGRYYIWMVANRKSHKEWSVSDKN